MKYNRSSSTLFACVIAALLSGCGGQDNTVTYARVDGQWQQIPNELYEQAQSNPEVIEALARNPSKAEVQENLKGKDIVDWTPSEIADLSVTIAKDICNVPEGAPVSATTPCVLQ